MDIEDHADDYVEDHQEERVPERVIVLDTETTGTSTAQGDRIVEIGCVEVIGNILTGRTWHTYLNPAPMKVHPEAVNVHGLTDDFLKDKPKYRSVNRDFAAFIGDSRLVIHNAPFDMGFLNNERKLIGLPPLVNGVIDTLKIARLRWPGGNNTLKGLCSKFGVDDSHRELHGALVDAEILADLYIKMMNLDRLDIFDDEDASPIVSVAREATILIPRAQRPSRPAILPSEAELAAHTAFVAERVKDSLWFPKEAAQGG